MRITRHHGMTKEAAKARIEALVPRAMAEYRDVIGDVESNWQGDALQFRFTAAGLAVIGSVDVQDTHLVVDLTVPVLLRAFENKIKQKMEEGLAEAFPPARE